MSGARPGAAAKPGARPGDIAREALRAARDAAERAREEAEGARGGAVGKGGRTSRGAVGPPPTRLREGRGHGGDVGAGRTSGIQGPGAGAAPSGRPSGGVPVGRASGGLPGDQAPGGGPEDPAPGEDRSPDGASSDRATGNRVRDVRELLADAFKLPSDEPEPEPEPRPEPEPGLDEISLVGTDGEWDGGGSAKGEFREPPPPREGVTRDRASHGPAVPGHTTRDPSPASPATGGSSTRREHSSAVPDPQSAPGRPTTPQPDTALPAAPRVPRTMAAPSRDGELRRTFRPFPPRPSVGEAFAESWWGNAWVTALEEGALDAARLARGRAYADKGQVDAITVTPGLVLAYVHGSRARPYRVQLRLRTLDDDEWDRFLDAAAEQPGHIAALLDKELPQALAGPEAGSEAGPAPEVGSEAGVEAGGEPGRRAARGTGAGAGRGVRLLPGAGELEPRCSCPDFGHPCKHAAALCYQTARLLDEDPFVLLLLRGRGERELLDALSRRNAARAARAAQEQEPAPLAGVRARDALAPRTLPPLPAPAPPPPHPEQPPVYPGVPGGPDAFALDQLATDAAARAHTLLTTGRDPVAELTLWQDAVRLAAARPGSGLTATTRALYSSLAAATGRTPAELARAVAAWRQGGLEGLAVLEEPWDPPAGRFDRARPLLLAADLPAFRPRRNHLTHPRGHVQLRLGRDGLWYAYESEPGHDDWWPRGVPDLDPVGALTGLGATDD
ncbi:SWIM zinc finger family protein [Streptomyces europaeiscabiei]|uniref:SWIM zinc finger family protein n=1 Tax=Streptomyces europaeiscabiei TaxID=146819 RepID=UPI0029A4A4D6|nr:SWIM zinc finger family protein [Streptomyces europaeiscabiei]MDX3691478.1 SWIM zinc finger family protein [Streptomyces europaeiscabiei]